ARIKATPPEPAQPLLQLRGVALDPAIDRRMVDRNAAFRQHFLKVAIADRIATIPAHRPQDHITLEMAPLEIRHRSVRPMSAKHAQASRFLQQSRKRGDCRFNTTCNYHIRLASLDESCSQGDSLGSGCARRRRSVHTGLRGVLDTDLSRGTVGHQHGHGAWRNATRTPALEHVILLKECLYATNTSAHCDSQTFGVYVAKACIKPCLSGRNKR